MVHKRILFYHIFICQQYLTVPKYISQKNLLLSFFISFFHTLRFIKITIRKIRKINNLLYLLIYVNINYYRIFYMQILVQFQSYVNVYFFYQIKLLRILVYFELGHHILFLIDLLIFIIIYFYPA